MAVCKFYQQGNCKYGNSCRFEHPGSSRDQSSSRPGAFGGNARGPQLSRNDQARMEKYGISTEIIEKDLTTDRPLWILSAYGPGRGGPDQLFGGFPREQSFEELRLHYVLGKASGNEQQALAEAQNLYRTAESQMQSALRNVTQAALFVIDGENRHPNRADICKEGTHGAPFGEFLVSKRKPTTQGSQANPFGGASSTASFGGGAPPGGRSFGQPSTLGQQASPFTSISQPAPQHQNASAFGSASRPDAAFGQAAALSAKPNPFGAAPAFGQPAQPPAPGSAFGQASQLGQQLNPFASSAGAGPGAFGSQEISGNQQASNPFASGSGANAAASPFGAFANNSAVNASPSPFGAQGNAAPSTFGSVANAQTKASLSPFGQATQSAATFGQQQQQQPSPAVGSGDMPLNPFLSTGSNQAGLAAAFGQPSKPNPFEQPASSTSLVGQQTFANTASGGGAGFSIQPAQPAQAAAGSGNPYPPGSQKQHPPTESYISKGMDSRISSFQGKPVTFKDGKPGIKPFSGPWTRIWFPDGPPPYYKDTELPPEQYDERSKSQWEAFAQTGVFQDGEMPELPPPRECTRWDF